MRFLLPFFFLSSFLKILSKKHFEPFLGWEAGIVTQRIYVPVELAVFRESAFGEVKRSMLCAPHPERALRSHQHMCLSRVPSPLLPAFLHFTTEFHTTRLSEESNMPTSLVGTGKPRGDKISTIYSCTEHCHNRCSGGSEPLRPKTRKEDTTKKS